jgi:hypothetical protein
VESAIPPVLSRFQISSRIFCSVLPVTEHLAILTEIHPFKQQSALAKVRNLLDATGIKSHPRATCKNTFDKMHVLS